MLSIQALDHHATTQVRTAGAVVAVAAAAAVVLMAHHKTMIEKSEASSPQHSFTLNHIYIRKNAVAVPVTSYVCVTILQWLVFRGLVQRVRLRRAHCCANRFSKRSNIDFRVKPLFSWDSDRKCSQMKTVG